LADENREILLEKVKLGKVFTKSEIFSEIGCGNLKQGGNASLPQGMDAEA